MSFDEFLNIDTPENVVFGYEVVGIGSRFMAALIDTLLLVVCQIVLGLGITVIASLGNATFDSWVTAIISLITFAFFWGYYIFFEMLWNGQTPGKRAVGLRVIRRDGTPITLAEVVVRNLIRFVDFMPFGYGLGIITMFIDKQSRRLGDMAAGTLVVREQETVTLDNLQRESKASTPVFSVFNQELLMVIPTWPLTKLSEEDVAVMEQFLRRRNQMINSDVLAKKLVNQFLAKMELSGYSIANIDAPGVVSYMVRAYYEQRQGVTDPPKTTYNREDEVF